MSQLGHFTIAADSVLFLPAAILLSDGIKLLRTAFTLVWISGAGPQSDSFEELFVNVLVGPIDEESRMYTG
jgi:hypothetical protein